MDRLRGAVRLHAGIRTSAGKQARTGVDPSIPGPLQSILLQVLGLAVAVSLLQLLFPVFTQMVVDKVIVENDLGLLKTILLGMLAALVFVQLSTLAQEYLLAFAAVRLDTAILDFLSRKLALAAHDLFHQPPDR